MKSNKGFTLIELLAVIVILAIIALIATPIILDVIDTAKKGAAESSALGYIDAVEKQVMLAEVDTASTKIPMGTYTVKDLATLGVDVKGDQPYGAKSDETTTDKYGIVTINDKGAVSAAWLIIGDYNVYYNGTKAVASKEAFDPAKGTANCSVTGESAPYTVTCGS